MIVYGKHKLIGSSTLTLDRQHALNAIYKTVNKKIKLSPWKFEYLFLVSIMINISEIKQTKISVKNFLV